MRESGESTVEEDLLEDLLTVKLSHFLQGHKIKLIFLIIALYFSS